ncbi:MAG: helix-turn-helix domain-containing protein [Nitrososphaeraceae archaeon]
MKLEQKEDVVSKKTSIQSTTCEVLTIWEVLGKRWALLILKNLSTKEAIRFNELKKVLSGISSTVLSQRLLELEDEGLVSKKIYTEIPPKVEYSLTTRAKELEIILKDLGKWANRWNSFEQTKTMAAVTASKNIN